MSVKVSKEEFQRYVDVQKSGEYNMFSPQARESTGLTKEKFLHIISHYGELSKEYNINMED